VLQIAQPSLPELQVILHPLSKYRKHKIVITRIYYRLSLRHIVKTSRLPVKKIKMPNIVQYNKTQQMVKNLY